MMGKYVNNKISVTSYTDNYTGSGHYCECGHELTWEEYKDTKDRNIMLCGHKRLPNNRR